ncbi:hypothetical protein VCRA2113O138_350037 [Vibrio crassostreae]|nr:hypothetical protein VCRA2113O138_350037 [Vibrio crassostreae]CAK2052857.1 hypothetical protein VCRA2113O137_350010 [Vibrio crassostreae]CAK2332024.1 hypothetical protein VCRA2116O141_340031 [Vibrio crassostreae]CAK2915878.1 hypothetical protein VCRA2119O148_350017 [Vibrio crassostreae]CAK3416763.1 hypothetical protein VCRA2121O156_340036 [Vibrio crassostreae]
MPSLIPIKSIVIPMKFQSINLIKHPLSLVNKGLNQPSMISN